MNKVVAKIYVLIYQEDYYKLAWYERDMMSYIDHIKCRTMRGDPDQHFHNVKVVNFDIIHHDYRGDKLIGNYKDYKKIKNEDLNCYPKGETEVVLPAAFRKQRDDLWVKRDLMIKYFKKNFK